MRTHEKLEDTPRPKSLRFMLPDRFSRSINFHMFTEDIQTRIMIRGANSDRTLITFEGEESECERAQQLCSLIGENRYRTGETIQTAIENIVFHLSFYGKALFELVRNSEGRVSDVVSFPPERVFALPGYYLQVPPRNSWAELNAKYAFIKAASIWRIDMPHELGGYRGYRKLLAEISKWPPLGPKFQEEDMKEGKWPQDFDIGDYRKAYEAQRFKATRTWGWNGRDGNSKYTTQYYQFYCLLTFRWAIEILRHHVADELNALIKRLKISARIMLKGLPLPNEILRARNLMQAGEIDFAKASKMISPLF